MTRWSARLESVQPFRVMEILARARELEAQGRSIIHMEIGEPDFPTPDAVVQAGVAALHRGETGYTPASGLPELRSAIANSYLSPARPQPGRVLVTPGASGALQLALALLLEHGDEVLLADPGYPCYRHLVRLFGGNAKLVPVDAENGFQLTASLAARHWGPRTRAMILASPSNPTGMILPHDEMARIAALVNERNGSLIVDEIYHGLVYDGHAGSVLSLTDQAFVVNSFSKYYGMTGWRVGWLVAPTDSVAMLDRLAQNMFLAASTPAQHAALAALSPEVRPELFRRRDLFRQRRDYLLPALRALGFRIPVEPAGAFYLYADCSHLGQTSDVVCRALLEEAGVAIAPGSDFGEYRAPQHVRFSYANTTENLAEGVHRLRDWIERRATGPG